MSKVFGLAVAAMMLTPLAVAQSPYAGEESRAIKSLSAKETAALERGAGMGMARIAELNHYPGPKHVLELATELELTRSQLEETEALFARVKTDAVELGRGIVVAEAELDGMFSDGSVTPETLEAAVLGIGEMRAKLRLVHLDAHLRQAAILTPGQIEAYDSLRGYGRKSGRSESEAPQGSL